MRIVYVAHPLGGGPDREQNRANASRWYVWIARIGHAPVADWIVLSGVLDEAPENRAMSMAINRALVERCDEVWLVGGRVSPGMRIEAETARLARKPVYDLTSLGYAPPSEPPLLLQRWIP